MSGDGADLTLVRAALQGVAATCVIDDQTSHHPRCVPHEPCAIRKGVPVLRRHLNIGLVQQGSCPQAHKTSLPREFPPRHAVQLGIKCTE